ncbi:Dachshund-like protein 1 [Anas platyrhynchos]|uniref:Dachshund-like protein 1 n=1 Tax=Anas platyrhynchos TaxID=8839 RepID=R0JWS0_ANAPL|nr:Dachshund-like protein 1 [Anas platyrhynchos]
MCGQAQQLIFRATWRRLRGHLLRAAPRSEALLPPDPQLLGAREDDRSDKDKPVRSLALWSAAAPSPRRGGRKVCGQRPASDGFGGSWRLRRSPTNAASAASSLPGKPVYSTPSPVENTPQNNECKMVDLRGAKVASFTVEGCELICLPQAFDLFLKHLDFFCFLLLLDYSVRLVLPITVIHHLK